MGPPQGVPPLVHGRGHGRDGVHRGRVQHERPRLRVPAVLGRDGRGGGRVRRGRGGRRHDVSAITRPLRRECFRQIPPDRPSPTQRTSKKLKIKKKKKKKYPAFIPLLKKKKKKKKK